MESLLYCSDAVFTCKISLLDGICDIDIDK